MLFFVFLSKALTSENKEVQSKTKRSKPSMSRTTLKSSHSSTRINPVSFLSLVFSFTSIPTASQPMSFANKATHQRKHSTNQDAYGWTSTPECHAPSAGDKEHSCYLNVLKYDRCFVIYIALAGFGSFMNVRPKWMWWRKTCSSQNRHQLTALGANYPWLSQQREHMKVMVHLGKRVKTV